MFTEVRQPGPRNTIWLAFTSAGVLIDAANAPDCLIQYLRAKIDDFMRVYQAFVTARLQEEERKRER